MEQKEFKSAFGRVGCHTVNIGEVLQAFDEKYVSEEGGIIKLNLAGYLGVSQMLINKLKESMKECENKDLVIDLGDGPAAEILESILRAIGFEL